MGFPIKLFHFLIVFHFINIYFFLMFIRMCSMCPWPKCEGTHWWLNWFFPSKSIFCNLLALPTEARILCLDSLGLHIATHYHSQWTSTHIWNYTTIKRKQIKKSQIFQNKMCFPLLHYTSKNEKEKRKKPWMLSKKEKKIKS